MVTNIIGAIIKSAVTNIIRINGAGFGQLVLKRKEYTFK